MLESIVDASATIYLVLAVVALILGVLLWRTRQRKYAIGLGIVALLAVAVFVLGHFVETDRERIEKTMSIMEAAVRRQEVSQIFERISKEFQYHSYTKESFRTRVARDIARVQNFRVSNLEVTEVSRAQRTGKITFLVKGNVEGVEAFYKCEAVFVLDPDNVWRLKTFELFGIMDDPAKATPLPAPF